MLIEEYIKKLKQKYNYSKNLINALLKIIPNMINYYGEEYENIILEAISNCPIYICNNKENIFDIINKNTKINKLGKTKVGDSELKIASGVYHSEPILSYNKNKNEIVDVKRLIALNNNINLNTKEGIATLTHELCHLVKGYNKEYEIEEKKIIIRDGLITQQGVIKDEKTIEITNEKNVGIEEGINSYDESIIVSNIFNENYESKGYVIPREIAKIMMEKLELKNEIMDTLFNKTSNLEDKYNENSDKNLFYELTELLDIYIEKEYRRFVTVFDKNETQKINLELKELVNKIIDNLNKYKNNIQVKRSV